MLHGIDQGEQIFASQALQYQSSHFSDHFERFIIANLQYGTIAWVEENWLEGNGFWQVSIPQSCS
jgi:hypothetical protein